MGPRPDKKRFWAMAAALFLAALAISQALNWLFGLAVGRG